MTLWLPGSSSALGGYHSLGSGLGTASRFLVGTRDAELEPIAFSSLLLFYVFPVASIFPCSSTSILIVATFCIRPFRFSSYELVLRFMTPARLPCAATRGGGERLTWLQRGISGQCFDADSPPRREVVAPRCCQSAQHSIVCFAGRIKGVS